MVRRGNWAEGAAAALLQPRNMMERWAVSNGIIGNLFLQRKSGTTKVKIEQIGRLDLNEETRVNQPEAGR